MAAAAARSLLLRTTDFSLPLCHHLPIRRLIPTLRSRSAAVSCLISPIDGGGVSDDFVSTRKSPFGREFAVIANMLKRIEPLDSSIISKGVSDSAKDSMKQTISSMLGLLPSDQFSVSVRVLKKPLDRLLMSSIITGYTLWNAEYRISLMRNFDIPTDNWTRAGDEERTVGFGVENEQSVGEAGGDDVDNFGRDMENLNLQSLKDLSPEALSYIQQLELELSSAKQELDDMKQENIKMEHTRRSHNDLLDYLRSLDSDMVNELSRPSSIEVEEITHHLVQNILRKFFENESSCELKEGLAVRNIEKIQNGEDESSDTVCATRDYLAKLLFWCMLLGHHLRGLENRLHLSCAVGLL